MDTLALPLDQRKYENVQKMADAALAWKGHIDILVNNAGGGSGKTEGDFFKRDPADIQNLIDINLTGSVFCSKAVGAMMATAGCGKIINIASISAFLARDRRTYHLHNKMEQPVDYAAAKGGAVGYTIDLAAVMSQYGVYVKMCIRDSLFRQAPLHQLGKFFLIHLFIKAQKQLRVFPGCNNDPHFRLSVLAVEIPFGKLPVDVYKRQVQCCFDSQRRQV